MPQFVARVESFINISRNTWAKVLVIIAFINHIKSITAARISYFAKPSVILNLFTRSPINFNGLAKSILLRHQLNGKGHD
jgi:hypothetical protein